MQCILLWNTAILYLYRCPMHLIGTLSGCESVHEGTYDYEFIAMCNRSLEIATTTAYATTVPATTTTAPTTTELPYIEPTTTSTTTKIVSTTTESPDPVTTTATTTTLFLSHQTTTVRPVKYPPPLGNNTIKQVERTIYSTDGSVLNVVAIVVSCLALMGCIVGIIYLHFRHGGLKNRKVVRPSQVSIDIPKTEKDVPKLPASAQSRGQPRPQQQPRGQPRPLQPPQVTPHIPPKPTLKRSQAFNEVRGVFEKNSIKDTGGTPK